MLENDGKRLNSASNSVATVKLYMRISSLFFFLLLPDILKKPKLINVRNTNESLA